MKIYRIAFLLLLFLLVASANYAQRSKFNPSGFYDFANSPGSRQEINPEKNPRGFKYFQFNLETTEWRGESVGNVSIKPRGTVTDENGDYKMKQISIKGLVFSFKTETVGGISYQFDGKFLKGGDFAELRLYETVVLAGLLIKTQDEKEVARTNRRYFWWVATH